MSLIFPRLRRISTIEQLLEEAYEEACDILVEGHGRSASDLCVLIDPITRGICESFIAGERDQHELALAGVVKALAWRSDRHLADELRH